MSSKHNWSATADLHARFTKTGHVERRLFIVAHQAQEGLVTN